MSRGSPPGMKTDNGTQGMDPKLEEIFPKKLAKDAKPQESARGWIGGVVA